MKVIQLIPGKAPRLTDKGVSPKALNEFFKSDSDHVLLLGLEHTGVKLGLFVKGVRWNETLNVEATKIVQYLKWTCEVASTLIVHGPAILYNDDGDITEEIWASVYEVIRLKKQQTIPFDLAEKLQQIKKECEDNPYTTEFERQTLPRAEHYGVEKK